MRLGLVASLNRPGGNATGVSYFTFELGPKRLGLLRDLMAGGADIFVLLNPKSPIADAALKDMAAAAVGQQLSVLHASNAQEINAAFPAMAQKRAPALVIIPDALFTGRRVQLATLAARHAIPAIYTSREFAEVGGLMSYGTNLADNWRQVGTYTGRILKGTKPTDLPVVQPTKFEFVINLATAKALGLEIPPSLLARADEVIEKCEARGRFKMKLPRRQFLHLAAGAVALPTLPRFAWAEAYPSRPVRIIVGYPPGGSADVVARLIGQQLSDRLGQSFVVENRTGAGTNIATEAVVNSAPDGGQGATTFISR